MVRVLEFASLQDAWEGVNLYMAYNEGKVIKAGGGIYGTEFIAYDTLLVVNKAWVDPNFDFGAALGYNIRKWTSLVKNYVDFNYLDLLKSELVYRTGKNARSYNYAYHFSNKFGGGKDCLIALIFSKRLGDDFPTVFFTVRTSEITCRLIFDFLLVQRICEYIYGKGYPVHFKMWLPSMYVTAERFSMFASHMGWKKHFGKHLDPNLKFQNRILKTYAQFMNTPVEQIKYRTFRRCAECIQKDEDGESIRKVSPMPAKGLKLSKLIKTLPKDVITAAEIRKYLRQNNI
jgi:hypothetical protein